jgi:bis(5'-nucleosyl)-tetraphosphatase (symmetrical)
MSTYLIGDVQGCFTELKQLLDHINFDPCVDQLKFAGDIVNRGPQSLETLRFIKNLKAMTVLGNHDLYLLIAGYGLLPLHQESTLQAVLAAPDKFELLEWLRQQPLFYCDADLNYCLVHAGIPPHWKISQALIYAGEAEKVLRGENFLDFLGNMYGNTPSQWQDSLCGMDRLRYIINALTRMRFCTEAGELDFENQLSESTHEAYKPWYEWRKNDDMRVVFGHWASLQGKTNKSGYYALDTGCVWKCSLTALRIEDGKLFSVRC